MRASKRMAELGIEFPEPIKPAAKYIPAKQIGNYILTSGQGPLKDGSYVYKGKLGKDLSIKEGKKAARVCALNAIAAVVSLLDSVDDIEEIVKVKGYVNSVSEFTSQPEVINGASELFIEIFGENGQHVRSALGASSLPDNMPVELELIVKIKN